ncbi:N-acetylglucosaminyldiphosphoundecaprenol N-acetyl-beta-D-mannosaminyltransferase [Anaerosolibacter carboniphilus]|uniref:N-acetylglucosaminyldiphosphoundecaprenol N-acetyl-beta-D-mannosaminyltransferase n=1 Tax=Anaerosolibacter carboniphilus TaxID=1417629 RepID=A0A841KSJ5_9FIRM|nr:WecB/TagA/CpsF family glycosyltransferase [Anaerosolibacter carboniphilus]MBB6215010.1 N-acetylglucosaminyldiphosphoundecaprenol N-acetyl-beta-D-mannosaminyltransferase [Anaerosolibacter carboniphilus]
MDNYVNILGIAFSKLNLKETVDLIDSKISQCSNKMFHLITVNPEIAVQIQEDPELKKISLESDLITPDGIGIVLASRLKRNPISERVTGYDLFLESLKVGNQKGWSFYLLGSDEEVNRNASEYIKKNYPNVKIAGRHHGYFKEEDNNKIVEDIRNSKPDILIVALGSPLADKWIYRNKNELNVKVVFGVGGSLDVITGKVKRTPEIWKKLNLEWLHRRITQPSRKERQKKLKVFAYRAFVEAIRKNTI